MVLDTMVNMYKVKNTVKENSLGLMEALIMENSSKITFKEKESIIGPMVVSMTDSGKIIRWKATASSHGQMVVVMKAHMLTTRKKVKETSTGPTVANMRAAGKTENNMESEHTSSVIDFDEDDDECFGDCGNCSCHDDEDDLDMETIAIRNYIENKHEVGEEPTLKQIQSRMKGYDLSCGEIYDIVESLGYDFVGDDDTPRSQYRVAQ